MMAELHNQDSGEKKDGREGRLFFPLFSGNCKKNIKELRGACRSARYRAFMPKEADMDVLSVRQTESSIREMGELLKSVNDARNNIDKKFMNYSVSVKVEDAALGNAIDALA